MAKGKAVEVFHPARDGREAVLRRAMGPSGNLRAPALRVGRHYLVGFHPEAYAERIG